MCHHPKTKVGAAIIVSIAELCFKREGLLDVHAPQNIRHLKAEVPRDWLALDSGYSPLSRSDNGFIQRAFGFDAGVNVKAHRSLLVLADRHDGGQDTNEETNGKTYQHINHSFFSSSSSAHDFAEIISVFILAPQCGQ